MFIYPKTGYQMSFCLDMYVRHDNHQIEGHGDNLKKMQIALMIPSLCKENPKVVPINGKKIQDTFYFLFFVFLNISST